MMEATTRREGLSIGYQNSISLIVGWDGGGELHIIHLGNRAIYRVFWAGGQAAGR